jgi:hypothetical protein
MVECLLPKPFWTDFGGILWHFFYRLVTMDETWIRMYDPEIKEQSPHSRKFKTQKSLSKVLASVFWDKHVMLHVDYLERVQPSQHSTLLIFAAN